VKAPDTIEHMKVLLVEDNIPDARLMKEFLAEVPDAPFSLEFAESLADGQKRIAEGDIRLVLLDLTLPDSFGLDTFALMHAAAPNVPIIVLSGRDDEGLAIKTVHEGAQDYLVKGQVDGRLLVRAMRYAVERKRAEEALAYERDLFHTLLNNVPDRIYFKDRQSRFLRISRAVAEQFKLNHPRDAVGKTDFDFFLPEHARQAFADEQALMESGQPILGKVEKETLPDGTITWALTSKLPLKDKQGRIIGNFGVSRDITELKNFEAQVAAERNLLRSVIDNLPDYIYVKDIQGRYLIDNIAHRQLVGVKTEQDVVGRTLFDFFPPDMAEKFARDDHLILQSGQLLINREESVVDHAGNKRWHATTKVPLRSNDGRIVGLVGISRDITERKLFEQQLQKANSELERNKGELEKTVADLRKAHDELKAAQYQLIQAEKMQSLGRLAAGIAHEVKNPLSILSMGLDYLSGNLASPDPDMITILTDMSEALKRADSILMGLLDFSVPRQLDLHPENLNAVVEQSLALVRHELSGTPTKLVLDLEPKLPQVFVDKNKLKQVFVNVLTNAVHAMPEGGMLTVRTFTKQLRAEEVDHDAGSRLRDRFRTGETVVVAEVIDSGGGIPEGKLAHVFDPFYTTKPTGKGTGLGLTVAKKIVELHSGSIDIRNRPEGGVIVTLTLKLGEISRKLTETDFAIQARQIS
jgi:PAS domain S-box-containing protein